MLQFIFAGENMIFSASIAIMLIIGVIEGIAVMFGVGASSIFDSMIPDMHIDAPDAGDGFFGDTLEGFLGWLHVGQVPVLMLLVIALTNFGVTGLVSQALLLKIVGHFLPGWLVSIPVFVVALLMTRIFGGLLYAVMPKDETRVISADSLIGRVAVITIGVARKGSPAEAKALDEYGQTHYFLVEPDSEDETFSKGDEVLVLSMHGHVYRAVLNNDPFFSELK